MSVPENWQTRAKYDWPNLHRIGQVHSRHTKSDITDEVDREVRFLLQTYYSLYDAATILQQENKTLRRQQQADANTCQALRNRISRSMSNNIAMNELSLEDTTTRCRPSNLANRYKELETVEWLAAKEELDSVHCCGNEHCTYVTQYLCDIFVEAMRISKEMVTLFTNSLSSLLIEPVQEIGKKYPTYTSSTLMAGQASNQSVEPTDMQKDLQRKVKEIIKERSDKCNIDDIVKRVEECMSKNAKYQPHILTEPISSGGGKMGLKTYISECCRLAWRMNVQTPPMAISVETGIPFDPNIHVRAYDCMSIVGATEMIDYYVWPTLYDAENHLPVRKKGRVYTKRSYVITHSYIPPSSSLRV